MHHQRAAGSASVNLPDYTGTVIVTDNCTATGAIDLAQDPAPGTSISGHNTEQQVTITATDAAGNQNSCTFTVTFIDNVEPDISCVENQTVPANDDCEYVHSGIGWDPNPDDNCAGATVNFYAQGANPETGTSLNNVTFPPGATTVLWTVTDVAGLTATCSFTVSIEDNVKPTASCVENQVVNTSTGACTYTHSGAAWDVTASDNCTVASKVYLLTGQTSGTYNNTLDGVVFNKGLTNVTVTVSDGASPPNTEQCSFTVTVNDNQNPSLTCPSTVEGFNDAGGCTAEITVSEITFGDNCPGASLS